MLNTISLKLNKDFRRLYGRGQSLVSSVIVVYVMRNKLHINRLGITVSKKNGCAVVRNRVRRIIKEAYRLLEPNLKKGYDLVLVARGKTAFVKSTDVKKELNKLLSQKGMLLWNIYLYGWLNYI